MRTINNTEKLKKIVADPILWCKYFAKIVDKKGQLVPFEFNPQQVELVRSLDKYNIILKSRQIGITSVSIGLSIYYCMTEQNVTCLLMSYSLDSARGIFEKLKQISKDIISAVKVEEIVNNRQELKFVNGSRIIVSTCGNKDVARGLTLKLAHLSEVGFMNGERVKKNILAIEQALRVDGMMILESTANGQNEFSEFWSRAEKAESLYKPFFFSWVGDKIMFKDEYKMFCKRYLATHEKLPTKEELDETELSLLEQGASIEQIVWRRLKIANSSVEQFKQEFPSNAIEAFVTSGNNVFNTTLIHERQQHIHKPILAPESLKHIKNIQFWKLPEANMKYYIGVDSAEGCGGDASCIEVIDRDGFQCVELLSNTIKPYVLTENLLQLAQYYNNAYCVVEKASAGHIIVDKMRNEYRYPNLHKTKQYDQSGRIKKKAGFEMTAKSRPIAIGDFVEAFENAEIWINSKNLYSEMKLFVDKNGRMEHKGTTGDDTIIAFMLALQGIKANIWYV